MTRTIDLPHLTLFSATLLSGALVCMMLGFMVWIAWPVLSAEGIGFIINSEWSYSAHTYGIGKFIVGTIWLTLVTLVLTLPIGIATAIFLSELVPRWLDGILRSFIELLVGIPSVVYGLFGYIILEPIFRDTLNPTISSVFGWIPFIGQNDPTTGLGIFLAAVVLTVMILPTVVALSREAMRAVPDQLREASYAMGTTKQETIFRIVIPSAFGGIMTSVVLATMRAMGETMAIAMLMGGLNKAPTTLFDGGTVMTTKILADIGYYFASPEPRAALFGIAVVLFLIEMGFVAVLRLISNRWKEKGVAHA